MEKLCVFTDGTAADKMLTEIFFIINVVCTGLYKSIYLDAVQ